MYREATTKEVTAADGAFVVVVLIAHPPARC
jgi:hypothetical protein